MSAAPTLAEIRAGAERILRRAESDREAVGRSDDHALWRAEYPPVQARARRARALLAAIDRLQRAGDHDA